MSSSAITSKPPQKSLGSSTKYTPTGDLKQTISRLQSALASVHYPKPLSLPDLIRGDPRAYLPILDWLLFAFSRSLAKLLCEQYDAAEMRHRSDLRFTEHCWRIFNECFAWTPALKVTQFLTDTGFVERKALLLIQLVDLVKRRHNDLVRAKKKARRSASVEGAQRRTPSRGRRASSAASTSQTVYGTEVLGTKNRPQQYFAEKAHQYEGQVEEVDEWMETIRERNVAPTTVTVERNTAERNVAPSTSASPTNPPTSNTQKLKRTMPAPSAPQRSEEPSSEDEGEDASISPSKRNTRFPISTDDEPTSPLPTAPPARDVMSQQEESPQDAPYENATAPPATPSAQQNDSILSLIDFKFQQFEKRLEQICLSLDGRMTMLEGKMNFLQDRIEEDRKSQVRVRTTGFGGGVQSSPVRRSESPQPRQTATTYESDSPKEESTLPTAPTKRTFTSRTTTTTMPASDVQISTLPREEQESKIDMRTYAAAPTLQQPTDALELSSESIEGAQHEIGFGIAAHDMEGITSETSHFINAMRQNLTSTEQMMQNLGISGARNALLRHSVVLESSGIV